ncbi:MAG: LysR family transcriptional regulator [Clostridiales Family XIII bacterium]|jgi:DNA-binding transcriptional LysR family regulator|nr:LysR family transcriptional regulator [Clostridiales Family XIII bacterium]
MDLHKLNVFVTAAQYKSFTKAANHLHIAQSAVSHDMAELEKELGAKLFSRTMAGAVLTPAGEVFFSEAGKMIAIAQSAKEKIEKITAGENGDLHFSYVAEQMAEPIIPFLKQFHETHPGVALHFDAHNSIAVSRRIHENEIDFGFGRRESLVKHDDIEWLHLYEDPFFLAVPKGHRLAREKVVTVEMIRDETIILMSSETNPGFFDMVQKFCLAHGVTPLVNATTNDRTTTIMMARVSMGLAMQTLQFLKVYDFPDIVRIPFAETDAFHDVGIAWNKKSENTPAFQFLKELGAYLALNPIRLSP